MYPHVPQAMAQFVKKKNRKILEMERDYGLRPPSRLLFFLNYLEDLLMKISERRKAIDFVSTQTGERQ